MNRLALLLTSVFIALPAVAAPYRPDFGKNLGFPIYTNAPSGKQLSGAHAPATTPALAPEESQKAIQLPPGFEARVFASEPEVVNPVAMTWDERGRLWVLELYEYPLGAKKGEKPRDRIKILEDTDADGRADKVTVWADGLNLASGLALGNGGAYVGAAPDFLFLEDTDGDGQADKRTVLKTGFGMEDRHELLNGFAWGPDGWLYLTHGVFTHSKVRDPNDPTDSGVTVDAAVARYHPRTKKFEVFADGTSNPWGVDFDKAGNAFVSACVIPHFFHMAPGGLYKRQGGQPGNPYAYGLLPEIADFQHYRAAHAGICIYQGDQFPAQWRDHAFFGNIHQSALNLNHLEPVGSTFKATKAVNLLGPAKGDFDVAGGNFLVSKDPWFRPVAVHTGPDGALWVMDWYDKYPCYQNANADPAGVDREHGRIWRIVWTGDQPGKPVPSRPQRDMDLAKLTTDELAGLLEHPNNWQRRMAQRVITERRDPQLVGLLHPSSKIIDLAKKGATPAARLAALWTLHSAGALDEGLLEDTVKDTNAAVRAWSARLIGERGHPFGFSMKALAKLAKDKDDSVRLAVATAARQFNSGSLTLDTPPAIALNEVVMGGVLSDLHKSPHHPDDAVLPFVYWMALEPIIAFDAGHALEFYRNAKDTNKTEWPMNNYVLTRIMRRVCDLSNPAQRAKHLDFAMEILAGLASENELANAALDGLIAGFKTKATPPTVPLEPIFAKLTANPAIADKARRLATLMGDPTASRALIAKLSDTSTSTGDRAKAIQAAREAGSDEARAALLKLVRTEKDQSLASDAIRALGEIGSAEAGTAETILAGWKNYSPLTRRAAADVLVTRRRWQEALLSSLEGKTVAPGDVSASAVRALSRSPENGGAIAKRAAAVFGKVRDADADKLKLIAAKRKVVLTGTPDLEKGREVARKTCFVCHKLHGEGAEVGPDLTGVGRSTLDALLANVIDPNQIIGAGYENVEVETKDGRTVSGRMVENTDNRIRLLAAGPKEEVVARSEIAVENGQPKIRVSELSVMPEALEQMPDEDFRNMILFILNPPEDKRPWTPALRRELIGDVTVKSASAGGPGAAAPGETPTDSASFRGKGVPPGDGESVALWNPEWRVVCPPFEGAPKKLAEFAGRKNVLMTHPADRQTPAALERTVEIPAGQRTRLIFAVAADDQGDWELRVKADGELLHKQLVTKTGTRWLPVSVDLSKFAGKKVTLRLENFPNDWSYEFGYWSDLQLNSGEQSAKAK